MPATAQQLAELQAVNAAINAIPYQAMPGKGEGYDVWIDDPVPGDSWECRDYVLKKGRLLAGESWPPDEMTIVTCYTEMVMVVTDPADPTSGRQYHAVLAVKAGGDIYILDSRTAEIGNDVYLWSDPNRPFHYLWWKQQIPNTLQARDARNGLV